MFYVLRPAQIIVNKDTKNLATCNCLNLIIVTVKFNFIINQSVPQRLFSGEIVRDSLIFWPKISLKLAKWEEKSHTKQLFSQTILPVLPQKINNFSLVLAWREIFYQGILEPELSLGSSAFA